MAVQTIKFQDSELWKKKIQQYLEVRDVNKHGFLQRPDFKLVIQRYEDMGTSEKHMKSITNAFERCYDKLGLVDDSTKLTYEEFAGNYAKEIEGFDAIGDKFISVMFQTIDAGANGEISFKEWIDLCKIIGINNTAHARASFDALDANSDGIVSREEVTAYIKEFFFSTEDTLNSSIMFGPLK